ncbi:MAG: pilin [Pseudomonadota bacterium]
MDDKGRQLAQFHIATDLSHKLRPALEFAAVACIVMLMIALGTRSLETAITRVQVAEALNLAGTVKADLITYRAQHGDWPGSATELANSTVNQQASVGGYVERIELHAGGSLLSIFSDGGLQSPMQDKQMTMQPVVTSNVSGVPIFWACAGYRASDKTLKRGLDSTDIDAAYLPAICKDY